MKKQTGITLIALVITIIVILILAGVTISALTGDNGLLQKAQTAKEENEEAKELELIKLAVSSAQVAGEGTIITDNLSDELMKRFGNNVELIETSVGWFYKDNKNYRIYKDGQIENADSLPSQYKQVEYIEANGTQYIDTEFVPDQNIKIEVKYDTDLKTSNKVNIPIYGNNDVYYYFRNEYKLSYIKYGASSNNYSNALIPIGTMKQNKNLFTLADGRNCMLSLNDFKSITPIYIFNTCGTNKNPVHNYSNDYSRIYYFKIWHNDKIIRDYLPAQRIENQEIGLYDFIEGKFCTNQGTGEFIAGPEV